MRLMDIIPSHYIVLTPTVPIHPYDLGEGHVLRAVKAKEEMFKGFSDVIPHGYTVVMALNNIGTPSYYTYRDLVFFQAFLSDDMETYEFGEIAQEKQQDNSDLVFVENYNSTIESFSPDRIREFDFDNFPVTLYISTRDLLPSVPEPPLSQEQVDTLHRHGFLVTTPNSEEIILNYRKAFTIFRELKVSGNRDKMKLYDQICLYVFAKNIKESRELYHNESAVVALYMAILQSIAGDPPPCEETHHCDRYNRDLPKHHKISREQHMVDRFGYVFAEQT